MIQKENPDMKIIAGLGNPTKEYEGTRHNIGFSVIDKLADKYNISMNEKKHKAICGKGMIEGEKVILLKPQTYMNLSGESVVDAVNFYKVDPEEDVIIIYDDIDLDVGKLRIRAKGSAGGHNGMKNIIAHLGTQVFPRIRVGVGAKPKNWDLADYVLGRFPKEELPEIEAGRETACEAVKIIVSQGVEAAMNRINGR
jgi:PTH1 family peptidyl-tRNA hydrolase